MTSDMTQRSGQRSRLWTTLAAASALALVLAAPGKAAAADYVDDPAYSQEYQGVGAAVGNDAIEPEGSAGVGSVGADSMYGNNIQAADDEDASADDEDMAAADVEADQDDVAMNEDEEVEVTAPAIRQERNPGSISIPGRMSLARHVAYSDLDLSTQDGAQELRDRVREAASEICDTLSASDPASSADYGPCYRQALRTAMPRANAAIDDARTVAYRD